MSFKKASLVAMLAVSMTGTQVLAQTATAASAPAPTEAARSGASMENASELRSGAAFVGILALIAIILGILAATGGNGDRPVSP